MATGYIEVCQPLPWRQSIDLGPYAWTWSGWRRYGSPSDETEPTSSRSGETQPATLCETKTASLGSGKTEPAASRSDETDLAALGETETASLGSGETEPAPKG